MPLRFPRRSIYGGGIIDVSSFETLPNDGERPANPASFAFERSRRSCCAVSNAAWLQTENCRANWGGLLAQTYLFSAISETLYPSRLLSFPTNPSLCPTSPKHWVAKLRLALDGESRNSRLPGRPMDRMETAWNTGIVLCDRDQADIWQPPLAPFLPSHCAEQFWIESSARKYAFFRIPTELNTQYWMPRFNELLPTAKIVHLAKLSELQAS